MAIQAQPNFLQFLVSDSFPNINPGLIDCVWKINAPYGHVVQLTWREFHIDGCSKSGIYIFDGKESEVLEPEARYCGHKKPRDFTSTGMLRSLLTCHVMVDQSVFIVTHINHVTKHTTV